MKGSLRTNAIRPVTSLFAIAGLAALPQARGDSYTVPLYQWNLLANQLDNGNNTITEIVPTSTNFEGTAYFPWTTGVGIGAGNHYQAFYPFAPVHWISILANGQIGVPNLLTLDLPWEADWSTVSLDTYGAGFVATQTGAWENPGLVWYSGEGMLFAVNVNNAGLNSITFSGNPRRPSGRVVNIPAGFGTLLAAETATNGTYEIVVGAPPTEGSQVYRLNPGGMALDLGPPNYTIYTFSQGSWSPQEPVLNIGEAAWFVAPAPKLNLNVTNNELVLAWTTNAASFTLESNPQINGSGAWSAVTAPVTTNGALLTVTLPLSNSGNLFFRLRQ